MAKRARVRAELRVLGAGLNGRVPHEEGARVGVTTRVSSVLVLVPWQSLPTTTISNGWRAPLLVSSFVSTGEHARYAYILFLLVPVCRSFASFVLSRRYSRSARFAYHSSTRVIST